MSFAQGAAAGQRTREQQFPIMNMGGAVSPAHLSQMVGPKYGEAPRMPGRRAMPARKPEGPLIPEAIHRRAAELALQEKEIDLQRSAVELQKMKEMNEIERRSAQSGAIEKEYQDRLGGIAADEALTSARQEDVQAKDFKGAMLAAHLGNGASVAEFINKYGGPNAKVESVTFDPSGSGEVIVKYPDGKSSLFKDPEQLYRGMMFFMDPKSAQAIAAMQKGEKGLGAKDRHNIMKDLEKSYDDQFKDPGGHILPNAPDRDAWTAEKYKERTREDWGTGAEQGAGAIQKPEGEPGEDKPPVAGAVRAPDGNWYVKSPEGWRPVVPKGTSVASKRESVPEGEAGTFDYGSGQGAIDRNAGEHPSVTGAERMRGKVAREARGGDEGEEGPRAGAASASWTDPKTGEKVTVTYDGSGKRTEKREKKDKKKKKDKSDA